METDPFKSPDTTGSKTTSEAEKSKSDKKDTKSAGSKIVEAGLRADPEVKTEIPQPNQLRASQSMIDKLMGKKPIELPKPETSILGIAKPQPETLATENTPLKLAQTVETTVDPDKPAVVSPDGEKPASQEAEPATKTEDDTKAENKQLADMELATADARLQAAQAEKDSLPDDEQDSAQALDAASRVAFYQKMATMLRTESDVPALEVPDAAEKSIEHQINSEVAALQVPLQPDVNPDVDVEHVVPLTQPDAENLAGAPTHDAEAPASASANEQDNTYEDTQDHTQDQKDQQQTPELKLVDNPEQIQEQDRVPSEDSHTEAEPAEPAEPLESVESMSSVEPTPDHVSDSVDELETAAAVPPVPPVPPTPPTGQGPGTGPGPGFGSGGGNVPPPPAYYGNAGFNQLPTTPVAAANIVSAVDAEYNARAAAGRGLLVGGVIGYFVGRHRGRKQGRLSSEKLTTPVRKNLEKQVKNMQENITAKESKIKNLVSEKMGAVLKSQDRQKIINNLVRPEAPKIVTPNVLPDVVANASPVILTETIKISGNQTVREAVRVTAAGVETKVAEPNIVAPIVGQVGELYSRLTEATPTTSMPATEVLIGQRFQAEPVPNMLAVAESQTASVGNLLAEVPLAAVVVPLATVERSSVERAPVAVPLAEDQSHTVEQSAVIPFHKKVEEFTKVELMQTAEKVTVQGVSLKEMTELGRLDEPALRRVVGEFLQGGDVAKAVIRETKEKEIKYERDPQMRRPSTTITATSATSSSTSGGIAGALFGATGPRADAHNAALSNGTPAETNANAQASGNSKPAPTPDAATLRAIRNRQMATVSITTILVGLAVIILLVLTK